MSCQRNCEVIKSKFLIGLYSKQRKNESQIEQEKQRFSKKKGSQMCHWVNTQMMILNTTPKFAYTSSLSPTLLVFVFALFYSVVYLYEIRLIATESDASHQLFLKLSREETFVKLTWVFFFYFLSAF